MHPQVQTPHRLSCHCGAVQIDVTLSDGLNTKRRCDCSFCRRRGAVAVSAPLSGITIISGADHLTLYTFGTHQAKHWFCKTCGIYTHHQRRSNPDQYGVNAACLEGINPRDLDPVPWVDGVHHPKDRPPRRPELTCQNAKAPRFRGAFASLNFR